METINLTELANKRALNSARQAAAQQAGKCLAIYKTGRCKSWAELERFSGIIIPDGFKANTLNYANVRAFAEFWQAGFEARLQLATKQADAVGNAVPKRISLSGVQGRQVGGWTLAPEQEHVVRTITDSLFTKNETNAILQDGGTGSGKTIMAIGVIDHVIQNKLDQIDGCFLYGILIITKPAIMVAWERAITKAGYAHLLGNRILITSYSQLSASFGNVLLTRSIDPVTDKEIIKWNPGLEPYLVILDESHCANNEGSQQTTAIRTLLNTCVRKPKVCFFSATPLVTVDSAKTLCLFCEAEYNGVRATDKNWSMFAGTICRRPNKPNAEAAKRLRGILSKNIVSLPYVKWPHRAINSVMIVDFENPADEVLYANAYVTYQEMCKKAGKNSEHGTMTHYVALGQFRKTVEPLRVPAILRMVLHDIEHGYAPVVGFAFRESVQRLVFSLVEKGIPRDKISIIWGGKRALDESKCLKDDEIDQLLKDIASGDFDPVMHRRLQETIDFKTDKIMNRDADEEAQRIRLAKLEEYRLTGSQSKSQRQEEIDKFQSGESIICIFTLPAGGVGLSLDHAIESTRPRRGYFTPTYNPVEVKQALGRCERRFTLSDTEQFIVMMRNTVEETHVAPKLDAKLQCIAQVTNTSWDMGQLMQHPAMGKVRDRVKVLEDSDKDEAQLHEVDTDVDDED